MNLQDLQTLEIGLELYMRENPLGGECERIISFLLRVVRDDISTMKPSGPAPRGPGGNRRWPFKVYTSK